MASYGLYLILLVSLAAAFPADEQSSIDDNSIIPRKEMSSTDLLTEIYDQCLENDSMACIRKKVLVYLDQFFGKMSSYSPFRSIIIERNANEDVPERMISEAELDQSLPRNLEERESKLDELILQRIARFLKTHDIKVQLPETFFESAIVTVTPSFFEPEGPNFSLDFPNDGRGLGQGRVILKKILIPLLLALKLKFKALLPLGIGLIGLKALKALILSKVAILMVGALFLSKICRKSAPVYDYQPYNSASASSYEPAWDSYNSAGPYSRQGDAQQQAYNAYYNQQQTKTK